jgi:MFS family permease
VGAVGGLFGSLAANRLVRRFKSAKTLIIAGVVSGASYLVMAVADGWQLAAPAFAVVGFAASTGAVVSVAMRQRLTPPEAMGRVGAASRGIVWGAAPVGALLAGTLASLVGLRLPLVLAGSLQCVVTLVLARPLLRALQEDASPPLSPAG